MGTRAGSMPQVRAFPAGTTLQRRCCHPPWVRMSNTILRHTFTCLRVSWIKLLLPSKSHRNTASFMEECTGTNHRVQGMLLLPAMPPQCCCLGGQESGLCVGQNCGQHAEAQVCQSHGTEAHATLAEMSSVMVCWERLGSHDSLPISPRSPKPAETHQYWSRMPRSSEARGQGQLDSRSPSTWCSRGANASSRVSGSHMHAGREAEWSGVGQSCRSQGTGVQEVLHTKFPREIFPAPGAPPLPVPLSPCTPVSPALTATSLRTRALSPM